MIYFIFSVWGTVCLALGIKRVNDVSNPPPQPHLFNEYVKNISWRHLNSPPFVFYYIYI